MTHMTPGDDVPHKKTIIIKPSKSHGITVRYDGNVRQFPRHKLIEALTYIQGVYDENGQHFRGVANCRFLKRQAAKWARSEARIEGKQP